MVSWSNGHDGQKRKDDDIWLELTVPDDDYMASPSAVTTTDGPRPTDDDNSNNGPPSSVLHAIPTGIPSGVIPWWASSLLPGNTLTTTTASYAETSYESTTTSSATTIFPAESDPAESLLPTSDTKIKQSWSKTPIYVVATVIPIIAVVGSVVFFCLRKRRKQRQIAAAQSKAREMRMQQPVVHAYMAPGIPASRAPSYTVRIEAGPRPSPPSPSPPPVILGPISVGTNGNYMTGIDTSDVMSTRSERTGLGDPFADGSSLLEEPPPPYKPRSLASRNSRTSLLRSSSSMSSQHSQFSRQQRSPPTQNPFEDPREDDEVSEMSGPTLGRTSDNMSVVSDLSYQQDPQVGGRSSG